MSILRVEETQYAQTTGVDGCGVVVWFGKYTDIASLVLLSGFTQPMEAVGGGWSRWSGWSGMGCIVGATECVMSTRKQNDATCFYLTTGKYKDA